MGWWILGSIVTVIVMGYVAHKYPAIFGKAIDAGASVVNKADDAIKDQLNKK
jgi:hypothetical protein